MQSVPLVVPGRKTDVLDAQWLCQLLKAGLLRASLVPPKPIRTLRNLTRYRKSNIRDRQREANRLHKILEDTGIKLDCVASDLLGKSGRAMLDALVSGTTDPNVLADLARGVLRKKLPALREALEGRFDTEHALVVGQILAHIDFLDAAIAQLSDAIEQQVAPFAPAVELLCTIPGVERRAAEVLIAETGGDMTAFPTATHLASWAGVCPGNNQSAGRRRSGRTHQGSKWLRGTLIEAARAAARTRDTYLNAQYRRVRARRGANRASLAVAHSLLVAVWHMLQTGETYHDPGGDYYTRRDPARTTRRLVAPARTPRPHRHPPRRSCCLTKRDFLFRDDEQARRVGLRLLSKGAVLAHRFDRPLAAPSDEWEQPLQLDAGRSSAAALASSRRLRARRTRALLGRHEGAPCATPWCVPHRRGLGRASGRDRTGAETLHLRNRVLGAADPKALTAAGRR
jgi:transposase